MTNHKELVERLRGSHKNEDSDPWVAKVEYREICDEAADALEAMGEVVEAALDIACTRRPVYEPLGAPEITENLDRYDVHVLAIANLSAALSKLDKTDG